MSKITCDERSTLVQVMAWYRWATSHYLSQCWPRSVSPYGVTKPQFLQWYHILYGIIKKFNLAGQNVSLTNREFPTYDYDKNACTKTLIVMSYDQKSISNYGIFFMHDDVIKWNHFPRYWPFERGIHRSPVNPPHKGQWRGALMFSLIYVWINGWVNNRETGDLRRYRAHYDVIVM